MLHLNYKYNYFIVIEFKIAELKARDYGQNKMYINYVHKHIKDINHDNTIGIIICKSDNKLLLEARIFSTTYKLTININ